MTNIVLLAQAATTTAAQDAPSMLNGILPMVLIGVIFYMLMIRPQQKQQKKLKAMIDDVKRGDNVVMAGGIHGRIMDVKDDVVTVQVANQVNMTFDKSAIQNVKNKNEDVKNVSLKKAS